MDLKMGEAVKLFGVAAQINCNKTVNNCIQEASIVHSQQGNIAYFKQQSLKKSFSDSSSHSQWNCISGFICRDLTHFIMLTLFIMSAISATRAAW